MNLEKKKLSLTFYSDHSDEKYNFLTNGLSFQARSLMLLTTSRLRAKSTSGNIKTLTRKLDLLVGNYMYHQKDYR